MSVKRQRDKWFAPKKGKLSATKKANMPACQCFAPVGVPVLRACRRALRVRVRACACYACVRLCVDGCVRA
eukprot:353495-Pleurochrysis_carterae.AAC.2